VRRNALACVPPVMLLLSIPAFAGLAEGRQLLEAGRYSAARRALEQASVSAPEVAERMLLLTRACNGLENWECGVEYGKQAADLLPEHSVAQYEYAVALRNKMQKIARFRAMFMVGSYRKQLQLAIDLDAKNYDARQEQIVFLIQAPGVTGGDKQRARELIAELKREDWSRGTAMEAEFAFEEQRDEDAVRALQQTIERDGNNAEARFRLGYWYQRNERYREADAQFAHLAELDDPVSAAGALYQRARSRILGKFEANLAVRQLEQFIAGRPEDANSLPSESSAYWRLGNAYEQLSNRGAAKRSYREALALDPDNKEAKKALRALGG